MTDAIVEEMLRTPVGPKPSARNAKLEDFTRKVEVQGDRAVVEVHGSPDETSEPAAITYLQAKGEDPALWEVRGFRSSEWTMPNGEVGESVRYTFARRADSPSSYRGNLSELLAVIDCWPPPPDARTFQRLCKNPYTYIVAIGDMQFGKTDGDGVEGTLRRTINCLNRARDRLDRLLGTGYPINHVHVAWLGDHIEGFNSQGGANAWRTRLTLNEQIRLTRRVMLHAMLLFSQGQVARLTMAAVPGNHGEAVRFEGRGITRYDDSHDTESLVAVADAAALNRERFSHVEFYVPETDELTVVVDCNGTIVAHAHGHQWNPNKQFDWWQGQAFNKSSAMHVADLLLAGHLHHEHIEAQGLRTFIGVPSMESESTWWRHRTGISGAPGLIVALTRDGRTDMKEVIRSE